jgi:hypothetical protein
MIRSTGVFLQTADFAAFYQVKFRKEMQDGILRLRTADADLPILKEWKSAKNLLARFRAEAAQSFDGRRPELGKVWLEQLPGMCGTPWTIEEDDYAQAHIRTRVCIIPAPEAWSMSGLERVILATGIVNEIDHRNLCSEINLSAYPRVHLIVDVKRPEPEDDADD